MSTTEIRITIDDVRAAGFCVKGLRRWFESRGLDFQKFLDEGASISAATELNDAYVNAVVRLCLERKGAGDGR